MTDHIVSPDTFHQRKSPYENCWQCLLWIIPRKRDNVSEKRCCLWFLSHANGTALRMAVGLSVHPFGPDWNTSTTIRRIALRFGAAINCPQRINCNNFDPLTFHKWRHKSQRVISQNTYQMPLEVIVDLFVGILLNWLFNYVSTDPFLSAEKANLPDWQMITGKWTAFIWYFTILLDKVLYNVASHSPMHTRTPMATEPPCEALACPSGATLGSVSPQDTPTHGQEELRIKWPLLPFTSPHM